MEIKYLIQTKIIIRKIDLFRFKCFLGLLKKILAYIPWIEELGQVVLTQICSKFEHTNFKHCLWSDSGWAWGTKVADSASDIMLEFFFLEFISKILELVLKLFYYVKTKWLKLVFISRRRLFHIFFMALCCEFHISWYVCVECCCWMLRIRAKIAAVGYQACREGAALEFKYMARKNQNYWLEVWKKPVYDSSWIDT